MATTTNYGWTTPDDTALVKDGASAIRTLGSSVDTTTKALNPSTTLGDLEFRSSTSNVNTRLGIGATGTVLTVAAGVPSWQSLSLVNPNLVINGNFTINQRAYVSAANLASGTYGFDRWKSNFTNTTLTYTSAPAGQSVTINSGGGLQQIVERANVPAGTYTLSFAGTATGRIYNVGATPPSYAASPISFTADGLADVTIEFTATGGTQTLSKVKLELGTSATAFIYAGNTIQGELAACQRYYYAHAVASGEQIGSAVYNSATESNAQIKFPVTMRSTPTLSATSGTNNYVVIVSNVNDGINSLIIFGASPNAAGVYNASESSGTAGTAGRMQINNSSGFVAFVSEL